MLTKVLAGPLFGAVLASGWWALAIFAQPVNASPGGILTASAGAVLVIVSIGFVVCCADAAIVDHLNAASPTKSERATGREADE